MPVGPGKYRVITTSSGEKVRLHWTPGGKVNEAKNLRSGETHTPKEFREDEKKRKKNKKKKGM
tara:strand:- start:74 stop:262 length:189 start_codon:yes stop_codon:yes gene_type:complete